jgi:hypothetical protein
VQTVGCGGGGVEGTVKNHNHKSEEGDFAICTGEEGESGGGRVEHRDRRWSENGQADSRGCS